MEAGEGAPGDPLVAVVALGTRLVETRLRAAVMAGCKVSFRLGADSRDGAAAADEASLPEQKNNNISP